MPKFRIDLEEPTFKRDLKAALKRHPSLSEDLALLLGELENHYTVGDWIPGLGHHIRKVRLGVKQQRISQRNGYRLIYKVDTDESVLTLLLLHYKPDIELISNTEIAKILQAMKDRQAPPHSLSISPDLIQ